MSFELVHLCSAVFEPLEESCFSISSFSNNCIEFTEICFCFLFLSLKFIVSVLLSKHLKE